MKRIVFAAAVIAPLAVAHAQDTKVRQHGPHVHGHGTLDIAIEGQRVSMKLEVPGADIVGFEHVAKSKKDKAAVTAARKKLSSPLALFVLPKDAGCKLTKASVEVEAHVVEKEEKKKDGHSHGHGHAEKKGHSHDHDEERHAEFHATYELACMEPAKLATITFKFFDTFKRSKELEVKLIAPKGQSKYEATPKNKTITLKGVS